MSLIFFTEIHQELEINQQPQFDLHTCRIRFFIRIPSANEGLQLMFCGQVGTYLLPLELPTNLTCQRFFFCSNRGSCKHQIRIPSAFRSVSFIV